MSWFGPDTKGTPRFIQGAVHNFRSYLNAGVSPVVFFYGLATVETLLDVVSNAGAAYGLGWGTDKRGLVFGSWNVDEPMLGTFDFSALNARLPPDHRIDREELLNLVRENIRTED